MFLFFYSLIFLENLNENEHGHLIEEKPESNPKIENEIVIIPAIQTDPEFNEEKPEIANNNVGSDNGLSNSFSSKISLSGLDIDEGEDRGRPLKLFFDE